MRVERPENEVNSAQEPRLRGIKTHTMKSARLAAMKSPKMVACSALP